MLQVEQAIDSILSKITPLEVQQVPLSSAAGRVIRDTLTAPFPLPLFDNSAMDGYAVRSIDLSSANLQHPVVLNVAGFLPAGSQEKLSIGAGECIRVFTGSPLPVGADAVLMQEDTQERPPGLVACLDKVRPWENIRFRGEDIKTGSTLVPTGCTIQFVHLGLLGSFGFHTVPVARKPVVTLLATGNELAEPGAEPKPGQIFESNRGMLATLLAQSGAECRTAPIVPDSLEATRRALTEAFAESDVVVTTGGVSVGELDFVKKAFEELGGRLELWKVAMKPGKPFVFGTYAGKFLFGLPGNPVSSLVTAFILVRPALLKMQGARNLSPRTITAVLGEDLANRGDRRHYVRIHFSDSGEVLGSGLQASHMMHSLAAAEGLLDIPAATSLAKGTSVRVMLF